MDRFEDRLRREAKNVRILTDKWMQENQNNYDLVINGGDIAMPLKKHSDRMEAVDFAWSDYLNRFGEEKLIVLTGNHELGHGYDAEPEFYSDLMDFRGELFNRPINKNGYGALEINNTTLLFIDSELIAFDQRQLRDPFIDEHARAMENLVRDCVYKKGPIAFITHNTARTRYWIRKLGLWSDLVSHGRQVLFIGGHFHVPRASFIDGAEVHWSGGGSYPEPWLRYLARIPFTGIQNGGPGAIELKLIQNKILVRHRPFGVNMSILKRKANTKNNK